MPKVAFDQSVFPQRIQQVGFIGLVSTEQPAQLFSYFLPKQMARAFSLRKIYTWFGWNNLIKWSRLETWFCWGVCINWKMVQKQSKLCFFSKLAQNQFNSGKCTIQMPTPPFGVKKWSPFLARVRNCPDVTILKTLFGLCLLSFCLFLI